jgi:hypothetical protein
MCFLLPLIQWKKLLHEWNKNTFQSSSCFNYQGSELAPDKVSFYHIRNNAGEGKTGPVWGV